MKPATILALLALGTPAAALAQVSESTATITRAAPVYPYVYTPAPVYTPPPVYSYDYGSACAERRDAIERRKAVLDDERIDYDRERDQLQAEGARLADDLRHLDSTDTIAVADYNARSADHNRRVAEHNRSVADMNAAVARLSGDMADATASCHIVWSTPY